MLERFILLRDHSVTVLQLADLFVLLAKSILILVDPPSQVFNLSSHSSHILFVHADLPRSL